MAPPARSSVSGAASWAARAASSRRRWARLARYSRSFLSPSTCGRILALNRRLYGLPKPERAPYAPQPMPFAAGRHQYWTADIRYIDHGMGDFKIYAITLLDHYSRAIIASGLSRTQDLSAFLMVFYMGVQ